MRKSANKATRNERDGTQSIERAITLLREIATRGDFGWQLSDLADHCQLGKSTVHRILVRLVRERLIRQRPSDRHYLPGPMLFELGLSVRGFGDLQDRARTRLATLAKRTGGVACLFFRSGDDFVCAVRVGSTALKVFTGFQGSRRPLVSSSGGAAILLALPAAEARAIVRRNLSRRDFTEDRTRAVRSMLQRSYAEGFAVNVGDLVPGVNSYGLALFDAESRPFASLMLAAAEHTLPVSRLSAIKTSLQTVANDLQSDLRGYAV